MDLNGAQQEARPSLAPRRQSNSYQQDEENKGEEDYDEEYAVNPATTHNVYSNESSPFPGLSQTLRSVGEWLYAYMACLGCCPAPASLLPSQSSRADAAGRASHHTGPGFRSDAYDSFGRLPSGSYSVSGSRSGYPGATNITHQQQQPLLPLASTSTSTGRSLSSGSRVCYPASASISALSSTSSSSLGAPFGEMEMEKHCAGLCLYSCGEVLLILRNSVNNDLTWDFPGGQLDPADYKTSSSSTSSSSSSSSLAGVPMYWSDRQVKPGKVDHAIYGFGSATWYVYLLVFMHHVFVIHMHFLPFPFLTSLSLSLSYSCTFQSPCTRRRGALREATEELGALPGSMELVSVHTSSRGGGSKLYTLYLCKVAAAARVKYTPRLSEEHLAWGW